jgi:hypothetical protein
MDDKKIIDEYIKLFDEIAVKTDNDRVALGILAQICKDKRMRRIRSKPIRA